MPLPTGTFTYRKGDTPHPAQFRLTSRNVRTGVLTPRPGRGDLVEITVLWPGRNPAVLSTAANGGLKVDPKTRTVTWSVLQADIDALSPGTSVPLLIRVINEAGVRITRAKASLAVIGEAA